MSDELTEPNREADATPIDDDWENRTLCNDESCIGIIGPDGRCKECGKLYKELQGGEIKTVQTEPEPEADIDASSPSPGDDNWENRTLCSDESCIGVIGPGGHCKECGKAYER